MIPNQPFNLQISTIHGCLLFGLFLASGLIIAVLNLGLILKLSAFLILCVCMKWAAVKILLQDRKAVLSLRFEQGTWLLQTKEGIKKGALLGDSVACPVLILLRFRTKEDSWWVRVLGGGYSATIFPDTLGKEDFRRLLMILKFSHV